MAHHDEGDHELEDDFERDEDYEEEISFDLPIIPFISQAEKRHKALSKVLRLNHDEEVTNLFITLATIVDPMTQPMESDTHVLSIELISDLVISLFYDETSITPVFDLSTNLFKIIESTLSVLNCQDEVKLRNLNNSDLKVDWRLRLSEWTPHGVNDADLRLLYMIDCVAIFTIFKLYLTQNNDLCLNPFLGFFLKLWKVFTNLVLLGLEIDRRIESDPDVVTPLIVKQVIRGSSSIRYVLASILNDEVQNYYHDFNHVNILDFLSPFGRRNGSGALNADVRWYVGAMLALGSDLNEVVETLIDLEPNDRYDEDIRYMFDYEYEDFHYEEIFQDNEDAEEEQEELKNGGSIIYEDEDGHLHRVVRKRCTCEFFDEPDEEGDKLDEIQQYKNEQIKNFSKDNVPTAIRSDETIEFDELGRDWRDIPRGGNIFFNTEIQLDDSTCLNWDQLIEAFDKMSKDSISHDLAQKVIFTIARAVKLEFEQEINRSVLGTDQGSSEIAITPDKIYEKWSYDWVFEPMLTYNAAAAYAMLDEMLMAHGYRRVIIWFITHLSLSFQLINYIFELLIGKRGERQQKDKNGARQEFIFSRQGVLELSEIEKSMLLHEFLNNCLIHLSKNNQNGTVERNDEEEYQNVSDFEKNVKIVKLICLLINRLTYDGKIELEEYQIELTTLFINWIGVVPEAREIFFQLNKNQDTDPDIVNDNNFSASENKDELILKPTTKRTKIFNPELKVLLSNVLKKIAGNNKTGGLLFQSFFELVDHENEQHNDKVVGDSKEGNPEGIKNFLDKAATPTNKYTRGIIKPMIKNEELEHEKIEEAILQR